MFNYVTWASHYQQKWRLTIHIFMVIHRSKSGPECRPTEYPAPELFNKDFLFF